MLENCTRSVDGKRWPWVDADRKDKKTVDWNDVWLDSKSVEHDVDENNYEELFKN
jgi:hypothetical protein